MKISRAHYAAAYDAARSVAEGKLSREDALDRLEKLGINRTSADFFIGNLKCMLSGLVYKRAMSADATDYFLASISKDGDEALDRAVSSVGAHLQYYRGFYGSPLRRHSAVLAKYRTSREGRSFVATAIDDLRGSPLGHMAPDRATRFVSVVKRDQQIREFVIRRAKGRCEFCGLAGFLLPNGEGYVEAHHIIGLADDGPDTLENVIALCPNHHREAHYGVDAEMLEAKFQQRLLAIAVERDRAQTRLV